MKNRIISVVAGIIVGWIIVGLGDMITHQMYPAPPDMDYTNKESLKAFINSLPTSAFIAMIGVWAISAFMGGLVTGKLAKENWKRQCLITGIILLLANVANMLTIPHPIWVNVLTAIMYVPLAYLGGKIIQKTK